MPCSPLEGGLDIYVWRYPVGRRRLEDLAGGAPVAGAEDAGPSVSDRAAQLAATRGPRVAALVRVARLAHHSTTTRSGAVKVARCIRVNTGDNIVKCYEQLMIESREGLGERPRARARERERKRERGGRERGREGEGGERERERGREGDRGREREREGEGERVGREGEGEREREKKRTTKERGCACVRA